MRKNPEVKAPVIGCKSMPNVTLPVDDQDLRGNVRKPSETWDFQGLPAKKSFMSLPNMALCANSTVEAPAEIGCKSLPNITLPVDDLHDLRGNVRKPSETWDFQGLPAKKVFQSLPDMALGAANSGGDAPEFGLPSVTAVELPEMLPVSTESPPCAESSMDTSMPPAAAVEHSGIDTPLSVSSLPARKVETGVRLLVTDTVTTRDGGSDAVTDPVVTAATLRRPRRSLWSRTVKFMRRMFCCGAIDHADV